MVSLVEYQARATPSAPSAKLCSDRCKNSELTSTLPTPRTLSHRQAPPEPDSEALIVRKLMDALRDLRRQGRLVRIRICPQCKTPDLRLLASHYDIGGAMGITPTKYLCPRCGYWGRVVIEATNEDISEEVLDDLLHSDIKAARTFLKEIEAKAKKPQ